jgi:hypothetical protein
MSSPSWSPSWSFCTQSVAIGWVVETTRQAQPAGMARSDRALLFVLGGILVVCGLAIPLLVVALISGDSCTAGCALVPALTGS